jgi:hypothetical protein
MPEQEAAPVTSPSEPPRRVTIIKDPRGIPIDVHELKHARSAVARQTGILQNDREIQLTMQTRLAEWANWLALAYSFSGKSIQNALDLVGFKLTKIEPDTPNAQSDIPNKEQPSAEAVDQRPDSGEGEH